MAKLILTRSEFADMVIAFLFDAMVNSDEIIVENEKFQALIKKTAKLGAQPLFMKYYLDMSADDRLNYKRLKRTLERGATTKSVIEVNPPDIKVQKKSGLAKIAKTVIKKLLLQSNVSPTDAQLVMEFMEMAKDDDETESFKDWEEVYNGRA